AGSGAAIGDVGSRGITLRGNPARRVCAKRASPICVIQNRMGIAEFIIGPHSRDPLAPPSFALIDFVIARSDSDEAIHTCLAERWIASLALAMTGKVSPFVIPGCATCTSGNDGLKTRHIPSGHRPVRRA